MIVRFEANIPQRLILRYAAGKEVEGQFGTQFLHRLADGNRVYLSPVAEQQLADLGVRDGEAVEICKRETWIENRRHIEWQVVRVPPEQPDSNPTAEEVASSGSIDNRLEPEDIPHKPPMDRAMTMYLIMAGRSTREAEQVLGAEGGAVRFDSRDITALATTFLIQSFKESWLSYISPQTAQQYDCEHLLHERKGKPAASETKMQAVEPRSAANACNFPPAEKAWTTRGEMKAVFAHLRELVGEVDYLQEMERAGVSSAEQLRHANDARACYERLVAILKRGGRIMSAVAAVPIRPRTLYELEEGLTCLLDCAGTVNPEQENVFVDELSQALTDTVHKRDAVAHWMSHCESQIDLAAQEIARLRDRKASIETALERIKQYVIRVIEANGGRKLEGNSVTFSIRRCPASVDITNESAVPVDYRTNTVRLPAGVWNQLLDSLDLELYEVAMRHIASVESTVDKRAIKAALDSGALVAGARIADEKYSLVRK